MWLNEWIGVDGVKRSRWYSEYWQADEDYRGILNRRRDDRNVLFKKIMVFVDMGKEIEERKVTEH